MAQDIKIRLKTILAYWTVIIFLGLPLWIYTTSIYRAKLPYHEMELAQENVKKSINLKIPIAIIDKTNDLNLNVSKILLNTQQEINLYTKNLPFISFHLYSPNISNNNLINSKNDYLINLFNKISSKQHENEDELKFSIQSRNVDLYLNSLNTNKNSITIESIISQSLLKSIKKLFNQELEMVNQDLNESPPIVVSYAPNYSITFSLFVGDGNPVNWEIKDALDSYFNPLFKYLLNLSNFTIDYQKQYYANLAFTPINNNNSSGHGYLLDQAELSTFINFADWSLSNIDSSTTALNFIIYIPSKHISPLIVPNSNSINAFLVPQWGGVKIYNFNNDNRILSKHELLPILDIFASQLLSLLGAPKNPPSLLIRLDILKRISTLRTLYSTTSTLASLYRLAIRLPNIAIPNSVLLSVQNSLNNIQSSIDYLNNANSQWDIALKYAANAKFHAENAFFEKMMVQQVYFPEEHKLAVYLPLILPVTLPLVVGLIKVLKEYKRERTSLKLKLE